MKYPPTLIAAFVFLVLVVAFIGYLEPLIMFGITLVAGIMLSIIRIANFILEGE